MKPYLNNLSSLRGIAAILVALLHFHFFLGPLIPFKDGDFIGKLYLMVDLFFILSGFIMCYVYEDIFDKGVVKKNYKNFLIARFARIYPLHFLVLTAEVCLFIAYIYVGKFELLSDFNQHLYRLDAIPVQLLFLETVGIFDFATWNMPAWSLSAEWWAYMIFPFAFILFKKIGYKKWFLGLMVVVLLWFFIEFVLAPLQPFLTYPPNPNKKDLDVNWHWGTLRGIVGFIAGMIVWQVYKASTFKNVFSKSWIFIALLLLSIVSMNLWYDTITVSIFMMIILSSAYGGPSIDKFYSFKILRKLGDWSFSIYIWHMFIINLVRFYFMLDREEKVNGLLRPFNSSLSEARIYFAVFILTVILIGYLSFKYIETPTRKWIRNKFK
ncbi:acyltransferase [Flavivirga abyssicola]|uniref:acyltransferase family protein n=1 Tax=Flavivirga abyssicola TaxID=3063533 RepID=UPI0026E092D6|nr:acyltransferase [Flavivirga sp. MEBiC07777]WVK11985.1 acyltransferase [Flavivirga sp. MEBiC07777]